MTSLFEETFNEPLPSRLRPDNLDEFVGQTHLVGKGKILRRLIETDSISSMIFWGPPGVGKTTLARIIASHTHSSFIDFSAVTSGIKEIREVMKQAENNRVFGEKTILFVDEIHRFNKSQQDAFLPFVEKGSIILIGATTENPSFEINGALLSRCKVFVLNALEEEDIVSLLKHAISSPKGFGNMKIDISDDCLHLIASFSNGDARNALSTLEMVINNSDEKDGIIHVSKTIIEQCTQKKSLLYDKKGEEHYNLISALHKSMRNSDPDAAIYWLARMLEAGEDPLYVARRVIRFASEDIGLADPRALSIANDAYTSCHYIGMPECSVILTQAVVYMSMAPKSNSLYVAYETAKKDALKELSEPVPLVIRNAPTKLMKELHYGEGYQYAHDTKEKITNMQCLPDSLKDREYYLPGTQGAEKQYKNLSSQVTGFVDLVPTLKDLVGDHSRPKREYDGISILPVLNGKKTCIDRDFYLGHGAVVNKDYKLIRKGMKPGLDLKQDFLVDYKTDPYEKKNASAGNEKIVKALYEVALKYDTITPCIPEVPYGKGRDGFKAPKEWKVVR